MKRDNKQRWSELQIYLQQQQELSQLLVSFFLITVLELDRRGLILIIIGGKSFQQMLRDGILIVESKLGSLRGLSL